ncbi:putative leucine-rich repeat domain superfamily [Helianthus annuus]|nr:putative leucine-rich repeat domain superfamily [Helianthus annuus]
MKSVNLSRSFPMEDLIPFGTFAMFDFRYTMTLTIKGVKKDYEKILNIFIAIDRSCNNLEGKIPQSLHDLHGLESLNLSNNHFTGHIFPSFGNLKNLESIDLSQNELLGQIPQQLLQLGFLAFFNVSFNHLDGHIPQGKQFNTFENNSYLGNPGLCGKPLSKECENSRVPTVLPLTSRNEYESLLPGDIIDWTMIFWESEVV